LFIVLDVGRRWDNPYRRHSPSVAGRRSDSKRGCHHGCGRTTARPRTTR